MRLRNSGRKTRFISSVTLPRMRSYCCSDVLASSLAVLKPKRESLRIRSEPTFEVMMMMVLRKSTLRPLASER